MARTVLTALGRQIGTHPRLILLTSFILLCLPLSFFVFRPLVVVADVRRGFAQPNGIARYEFKVFSQFYRLDTDQIELMVALVKPKPPHSALYLTEDLLNEIARLDTKISNSSVEDSNGRTISYGQVQSNSSDLNFLFYTFKSAYSSQIEAMTENGEHDPNIHLTYPNAKIYGHRLFLASHFFGVTLDKNYTEKGLITEMAAIDSIALWYMAVPRDIQQQSIVQQFQMQIYRLAIEKNFSTLFDFHFYGDQVANAEMNNSTRNTTDLLSIGMCLMFIYIMFVFRRLPYCPQMSLATAAVGSPCLASATTFGVLGWLGVEFNSIMCLTPFLILGIGVDDAFLLMHSWQRFSSSTVNARDRMAVVMAEIGPSVAITSVTNSLAFSIGVLSPAPQISAFCLATAIAAALDLLLEFVIFAPVLVMTTARQQKKPSASSSPRRRPFSRMDSLGSFSGFWMAYSRFLLSTLGKCSALVLLVSMYTVSYTGIIRMQSTFSPEKTFSRYSPLTKALQAIDRIYHEYAPLNIIVNAPPHIDNASDYVTFMNMINELEHFPESYGSERTLLWLRDYEKFDRKLYKSAMRWGLKNSSALYRLSYENVAEFLTDNQLMDKNIVHFHLDKSFVFLFICRGLGGWHERAHFVHTVREVLLQYPQYNATVFDYDATIFDLITTVKEELIKAVLITLGCMALVCGLFIPNVVSVALATISIVSISFTLLGMLSWLGLDLDPITMVNVIMAIGFSVDFSAHITFHFYKNVSEEDEDEDEQQDGDVRQLAHILEAIGKPMLEAGLSTIICMLPLFLVSVYVVLAFAKTVSLVAVLGVTHGLFLLPMLLSMVHKKKNRCLRLRTACQHHPVAVSFPSDLPPTTTRSTDVNSPLMLQ